MTDSVPVALTQKPAVKNGPVVMHEGQQPWSSNFEDVVPFRRGKQRPGVLWLTCDRKVSPRGKYQKSRRRWVPSVPNSFGLPAGTTCPGKTDFCKSCYADVSERQPGVKELVEHNYRLLQEAGSVEAMTELLDQMFSVCEHEFERRGIPAKQRIFRLHWDGDVWSLEYAEALVLAMRRHPGIRFWIYTRSFGPALNVLPILVDCTNLALYISIDSQNVESAIEALDEYYPRVQPAYCAEYYDGCRALEERVGRKALICPENDRRSGKRRIPLMGDDGSGNGLGACVSCMLCTRGNNGVYFSQEGVESSGQLPLNLPPKVKRRPGAAYDGQTGRSGVGEAQPDLWSAEEYVPPPAYCGYRKCRKQLPEDSNGHKKYCDKTCRWAEYRLRKGGQISARPIAANSDSRSLRNKALQPKKRYGVESSGRLAITLPPEAKQPSTPRSRTAKRMYSDDFLLEHLRVVARYYGKRPDVYDLMNYRRRIGKGPTEGAYKTSAFKSLPKAREAAGIPKLLEELNTSQGQAALPID